MIAIAIIASDELDEQAQVDDDLAVRRRRERLREDRLLQERRHDTEPRGDEDQDGDDAELRPVGAEEPTDPAQVGTAHRLVGGALDLLARHEPAGASSWHSCQR